MCENMCSLNFAVVVLVVLLLFVLFVRTTKKESFYYPYSYQIDGSDISKLENKSLKNLGYVPYGYTYEINELLDTEEGDIV